MSYVVCGETADRSKVKSSDRREGTVQLKSE